VQPRSGRIIRMMSISMPLERRALLTPAQMHAFREALVSDRSSVPVSAGTVPKRPTDSLLRVILPFASNRDFRASFVNHWGHIRFGLLLEELDFFAGPYHMLMLFRH
jgi:hypothetical protein